ncbi:MAG: hypothetical protein ACREMA_03570, partial [Longimicrobiales bacterium]
MSTTTLDAQAASTPGRVDESSRFGLTGRNWTHINARFSGARDRLGAGAEDAGHIALIDMGGLTDHPDVDGRVVVRMAATDPSTSGHAMEVAGVLAACCDATLHLYNVWNDAQVDSGTLYQALDDVATSGA